MRPCMVFCFTVLSHSFKFLLGFYVSTLGKSASLLFKSLTLLIAAVLSANLFLQTLCQKSVFQLLMVRIVGIYSHWAACASRMCPQDHPERTRWTLKMNLENLVMNSWIYSEDCLQDLPGELQEARVCPEIEGHLNVSKIGALKAERRHPPKKNN